MLFVKNLLVFFLAIPHAASYKRKLRSVLSSVDKEKEVWKKNRDEQLEEGRRLVEGEAATCVPDRLEVTGCDSATIIAAVKAVDPDCTYLDELTDRIDEQCNQAKLFVDGKSTRNMASENALLRSKIDDEEDLFIHYMGGGDWNLKTDSETSKLQNTANKVKEAYDNVAQNTRIAYPRIAQFQQDETYKDEDPDLVYANCELNAVMCCWSRDRQANDNDNGNCAEPYDENCVDADPSDNTDICYVDHSRQPLASRTAAGISFFGEGHEEGATHCHGFVWEEDSYADQARFAGNNLFYVSMYDHMYTRGYVQNIPGAPMCGCLEQMPTVSRSDCTELEIDEVWELKFDCGDIVEARRKSLAIAYNACNGGTANNDLESEIITLYGEDGALPAAYRKYLVGANNNNDDDSNCPATIDDIDAA